MKIDYLKRLVKRIIPHRHIFTLIILNTVISNICALFLPCLMADIVDVGIKQQGCRDIRMLERFSSKADILQNQVTYIIKIGMVMLALTGIIIFISIWTSYLHSKLSSKISCSLREDLFKKITNFSHEERKKFSASSLLTRCIADAENVTELILLFSEFLMPPIMICGGTIMIMNKSSAMGKIVVAGAFIISLLIYISFKVVIPKTKALQCLSDKFNRILKERLTGISITRIFGNENYEAKKFKNIHGELKNTSLFVSKVMALSTPLITVFMNMLTALILWVGANEINKSKINIGDMMAFLQYSAMVITAFLTISVFISSIPRSWVSVERVYEVLSKNVEENKILFNNAKVKIDKIDSIEFKNLSFKYPGAERYALKDINFKVNKGNRLGIIGTMGSGKSTVIKLLMGFYDFTGGDILINGKSIKDLDKKEFLKNIAYVPQNGSIFSGSIISNLKLADPNVDEDIAIKYAKLARIDRFIHKKGLDFKIERAGANISGGQRQRLALLRAMLKNADVYILDDSFSKLDFKTGVKVRNNVFSIFKEKMFIVISQRIETIKNLDKILVLDKGKVVGFGSHEELLKNCGIYKEMVALQFGGEIK